ncbi:MAG: DUF2269 family protein [Burkholderiaceae bacterium]
MEYLIVKWLHVLSSTFLFGTGVGTAYFLFFISRTREPTVIAAVAARVVKADWLFTATTVIAQPLTGWYLMQLSGASLSQFWLRWSVLLFGLAVICWLPVIALQMRLRDLAAQAARNGQALPPAYDRCMRCWVALGVPAAAALVAVFYLMVAKPA